MKLLAAATIAALAAAAPALAQGSPEASTGPGDQSQGYRPGLGDLMTATVQPRHIKLGLAGQQKNWVYAAYELHDLQEAFQRAAGVWPTWQSIPVGQMMAAITKPPFDALADAIKAKDGDKFAAAYKQLTEACDSCHQAADRGMIVIQVPEGAFFPDQDFKPQK